MHVPKSFQETNLEVLNSLIFAHPLGTWVTKENDELDINHIPFILDETQGEFGVLRGHINKSNPICNSPNTNQIHKQESIVVFKGADSYISPSWYATKKTHGKVVPTWNYVVVHAHGVAQIIDDEDWLIEHLNALTDSQELRLLQERQRQAALKQQITAQEKITGQATQQLGEQATQQQAQELWKLADAPDEYIQRMVQGIVGIEIPIRKLVGTWKTSQNKQTLDKQGVIAGLTASADSQSQQMAAHVAEHLD